MIKVAKQNNWNIKIDINLVSVTIGLSVLLYAISSIWAVDSGMAILGFVKFLPLLLFLLLLKQYNYSSDDLLQVVPATMVGMTLVSAILMQIDIFESYFSVAGRISGFFQYSNTYALMALVALIIEATREKITKIQVLNIIILLLGIIYSGSRTVFVLTAVVVLAFVFVLKNKKVKFSILGLFVVAVMAAVIYAKITGEVYAIGRFLTISLTDSTFVGRLLYWQDALKIIVRHPFGTGYMGLYYLQQSIQTGVYSIRYVHNDFLQLMLDIGWIPPILLLACIAKAFFKKGNSERNRMILFVILAHSCFDFDLQFVAVFLVLLVLINSKDGKEYSFRKKKLLYSVVSILIVINAYFGLATSLSYFNAKELSAKIYPFNTQNNIDILTEMTDPFAMNKYADELLKQNKYLAIAYDAKGLYSYSIGNIENMINYKDKAIELSPFVYGEYSDYLTKLVEAIKLYQSSGDYESADYCIDKLNEVVSKLYALPDKTSKFGKMIDDQMTTSLPVGVLEFVEE